MVGERQVGRQRGVVAGHTQTDKGGWAGQPWVIYEVRAE